MMSFIDMMNEIKPCPFCGSKAYTNHSSKGWAIECSGEECGACQEYFKQKDDVIKAWNSRIDLQPITTQPASEVKVSENAKDLLQFLKLWEVLQGIEKNQLFNGSKGLQSIREGLRCLKLYFDKLVKEIKKLILAQAIQS